MRNLLRYTYEELFFISHYDDYDDDEIFDYDDKDIEWDEFDTDSDEEFIEIY